MKIKQGSAVQFRDDAGIVRCGVVRDFVVVDTDGMLITATVRGGMPFTFDNSQIILKAIPRNVV
jgi:hypothetical protein